MKSPTLPWANRTLLALLVRTGADVLYVGAGAVRPGSNDRALPAKPYQIGTLLNVVCGMNVFERLERQICSLVAGGTAESIELLALVVGSAGHSLRFKCVFRENWSVGIDVI